MGTDWSYDVGQWYALQLTRATTPERIATIDAEYGKLRSEGPDFVGYHSESDFREPPPHTLTREDRIRILTMFDGIRANLYKHCRSERGQAVSRNYREVLGVLLSFAVKRGRVFPSLETIARMALVSKRTVLNALAWLALYGFVEKLRRIVRRQGMLGPRTVQTSNAYMLRFPSGLGALAADVFRLVPGGNNCPPSDSKGSEEGGLRGSGFEFAVPPPPKPQRPGSPRTEASLNWRDRARAAIGKAPLHEEL
jgi:Helix-turn-helix domain